MKRFSRQRETILEVLRGTDSHPNADWVYDQVRQELPSISLGTIYRNLGQLEADGRIRRLLDDGHFRYDANIEPHDHFRCLHCRRMFDVRIALQDIPTRLPDRPGFKVTDFNLELMGICDECQTQQKRGNHNHDS